MYLHIFMYTHARTARCAHMYVHGTVGMTCELDQNGQVPSPTNTNVRYSLYSLRLSHPNSNLTTPKAGSTTFSFTIGIVSGSNAVSVLSDNGSNFAGIVGG